MSEHDNISTLNSRAKIQLRDGLAHASHQFGPVLLVASIIMAVFSSMLLCAQDLSEPFISLAIIIITMMFCSIVFAIATIMFRFAYVESTPGVSYQDVLDNFNGLSWYSTVSFAFGLLIFIFTVFRKVEEMVNSQVIIGCTTLVILVVFAVARKATRICQTEKTLQ